MTVIVPLLKELDLIRQGASHLAIFDKDADVHDRRCAEQYPSHPLHPAADAVPASDFLYLLPLLCRWSEGGEGQKHGLLSGECLVLRSRVGSRCETVRASYQREP